jgi:hypothetical protein
METIVNEKKRDSIDMPIFPPVTRTKYKNEWYKITYNQDFLQLDKDGELHIDLMDTLHNWQLSLKFITTAPDGEKNTIKINYPNKKQIEFTFHDWNSERGTENLEPIVITGGETTAMFKIRSTVDNTSNWRRTHITIWTNAAAPY